MKTLTILAALVVPVLIAATFVAEAAAYHRGLAIAAFALAILVAALVGTLVLKKSAAPPVRAQALQPPPPAAAPNQAEAEIVTFLSVLQDKGRLVDFLMDDITAYDDRQVGAAARVVHSGCRSALQEHFTIRPIRDEAEGADVTVSAGYAADEYRFVGRISGDAPFSGKLIHRGWRTESVQLPRVLTVRGDRLPTIAPAEVELR